MSQKRPLSDLAESLVSAARANGADEAEVTVLEISEFNVEVRLGEIESLTEAGTRSLSLRVIKDKKTAYTSSSDLSKASLKRLVANAVKRAELANPDTYSGLPRFQRDEVDIEALNLFDPRIPDLSLKEKIGLAKETERLGLQDHRITNSHGASFETRVMKTVIANSLGLSQNYKETYCGLSLGLQAGETDTKVEDFWASAKRQFKELASPEDIASKCIKRTVRQLRARKIPTQRIPVVFEPTMTSWLLGFLFACVSGTSIYQKTSFLSDKLGEKIADKNISIYDDGLLPGLLGTTPFDSEGVPTKKTVVIEKGVLKNYLCNTYAAKKLGLSSTGNADGTGVGPHNFYLEAGLTSPEEIIASLDKGLILIRTLGHGLNPITGDISRGAFGLWVENGEILFPVSEITVSGNLGKILQGIELIGNDLEFRGPVSGPTLKVRELTIAGT
ncbi:MAG: TldD/PmbA family protein [Candidatus Aminicenantes bacterium]|nr:TldD/PmbA family protein [Candidatus Aminicenantes bacterium]